MTALNGPLVADKVECTKLPAVNCTHKSLKKTMHNVGVGTDPPHAQIKFLKQEIKQKRFRSTFEIKKLK